MPAGVVSGVEVRWVDLDPDPDELAGLEALLDDLDHARVARRATPELRRRLTVSLGARRRLGGAVLGVAPDEVELVVAEDGRRAVRAGATEAPLSVSSAGDVGLMAVGSGVGRLGVDVEAAQDVPSSEGFVVRVASDVERRALARLDGRAHDQALLRLWTRKEAYLKATGEGIGAGLGRVTVPLEEPCWATPCDPVGDGAPWRCYSLGGPSPGLDAALLVEVSPGTSPEVRVA
jgi:4'-phosphopantetheinyl transferase